MTRVLVVEDEESFSDALSYMLRKEGYEVAVATTGPAALEVFDRSGADLVLLDLMLPGLPGTEVCRQLRTRSAVPVIMLTAPPRTLTTCRSTSIRTGPASTTDVTSGSVSPRRRSTARIRATSSRGENGFVT